MDPSYFLRYLAGYIDLAEDEEQELLRHLYQQSYEKSQFIGRQGEICRVQSFILSGGVRTYYLDKDGKEHIISFAIENWWAGDLGSFVTQTPADYNIQCFERTKVIHLSFDALNVLYDKIPKLERFYRILTQNAYVAAQRRLVCNYTLTASERYAKFSEEYPQIEQRVPQYMIASYLGITREFLSKIRRQQV